MVRATALDIQGLFLSGRQRLLALFLLVAQGAAPRKRRRYDIDGLNCTNTFIDGTWLIALGLSICTCIIVSCKRDPHS